MTSVRDESELKRLHEQLTQSERSLRQLFFYAPDAVIVIDTVSIIRYWNPKAEQIFGWDHKEVIGRPLTTTIIPPAHRKAHEAGMKRFLASGEAHVLNKTIEVTALHKGGKEFFVALTISSFLQDGKTAFMAFIRDIDQQRKSSEELVSKTRHLEESNRQLEQFAHVISHDLKEPIRKILMFSDRLRTEITTPKPGKSSAFIDKIESAASRLQTMVDGVLRNSLVKSEELILNKVDLNEVIRDVKVDLEVLLEDTKASIDCLSLPTIEGSETLLYQLFYNLISNSLKFGRPEVLTRIQLTATKVAPGLLTDVRASANIIYYKIEVKDNGIGFPQRYSESLFNVFSRLHSKERYEGTGIGLSLCKNIVEKHRGFINAIGEENKGATFEVFLPETQRSLPDPD